MGKKPFLFPGKRKLPTFQLWRKANQSFPGALIFPSETFPATLPAHLISSPVGFSPKKVHQKSSQSFREFAAFDLIQKSRWRKTQLCLDLFQGKEFFTFNSRDQNGIFFWRCGKVYDPPFGDKTLFPLSKTSLMVCRFNPVAFLPREKNGKTSWVRPELVPKISFCLGKKSVLFLEKTKHSGKN